MNGSLSSKLFALAVWGVALATGAANAATITVQDSIDDFEAQRRSDTGVYIAGENVTGARIGHQSNFNGGGANPPGGIEPVFFFQLPALGVGESVTSASFSIGRVPDSAASAATPTFNADLYALGVIASPIVKTALDAQHYFYTGNTAQSSLPTVAGSQAVTGSVSRVADDFFTPSMFIASTGTAAAPDSASVTAYIQNLYANPIANGFVPGSSYLVMRINPDANSPPTSGTQRYSVAWQGTLATPGLGDATTRPLITLNTVTIPEPTSIGLLALSTLGMISLRRRGQ